MMLVMYNNNNNTPQQNLKIGTGPLIHRSKPMSNSHAEETEKGESAHPGQKLAQKASAVENNDSIQSNLVITK